MKKIFSLGMITISAVALSACAGAMAPYGGAPYDNRTAGTGVMPYHAPPAPVVQERRVQQEQVQRQAPPPARTAEPIYQQRIRK